jgi:PIN domain nuclease of toxin-antitoxin system
MSSLLLDSNALIAYLANSRKIGPKTRALLDRSELHFSSLSLAELRLKEARIIGFRLGFGAKTLLKLGFREIPFTAADLEGLVQLPTRDPFDILLFAQAKNRGLTFVTADLEIVEAGLSNVFDLTS